MYWNTEKRERKEGWRERKGEYVCVYTVSALINKATKQSRTLNNSKDYVNVYSILTLPQTRNIGEFCVGVKIDTLATAEQLQEEWPFLLQVPNVKNLPL